MFLLIVKRMVGQRIARRTRDGFIRCSLCNPLSYNSASGSWVRHM